MPANKDLIAALQNRDFDAAQAALDAGADLNAPVPGLRSPNLFHYHMSNEGLEQAKWLHERGADIQAVDTLGDTALMKAVEFRRWDAFELALKLGVDINKVNLRGVSPVLRAVLVDSSGRFLRRLLKEGADPSMASLVGATPLMAAASAGRLEMVQDLFAAGADPRGFDEVGQNIIYAAVISGDPRILKLVLEKTKEYRDRGEININHAAANHSEPISKAAMIDAEMVLMLLREGANPNAQSKNKIEPGLSPLMMLAYVDESGDASLVKEGLSWGANPNLRDHQGNNALFYAVQKTLNGKSAVLQALIDAGMDPASPLDQKGFSPIHLAILAELPEGPDGEPVGPSREQIVEKMLEMGFPSLPKAWVPPKQDKKPKLTPPPLLLALMRKEMEVARVILEKGTPLNELDGEGLSVLHRMAPFTGMTQQESLKIQITQMQLDAFEEFQASSQKDGGANTSGSKASQKAAEVRKEMEEREAKAKETVATVASWLSHHGGDWNLRGAKGATPTMTLARSGGKWMLGQVVKFHGADLALKDDLGRTAADHALEALETETLHAIVGYLARSPEGFKPIESILIQAALTSPEVDSNDPKSFQRRAEFIQAIITLPKDSVLLEARDGEGNTPLIVASATGQMDLVSTLLALGANPNAQNNAGETALLHAVNGGEEDIVRLLRAAGAQTELGSASGILPRDLIRSGDTRMRAAFNDPDPAQMPTVDIPDKVREKVQDHSRAWDSLNPAPSIANSHMPRRMAM